MGPIAGGDPQSNAIAVIDLLLAAGADMNARICDTSSRTAAIARPSSDDQPPRTDRDLWRHRRGWVNVAKHLIDKGAQLDIKDAAGKTVIDALSATNAGGRENLAGEEMAKADQGGRGRYLIGAAVPRWWK